jgi:DNA-binding XRE family transcriptional regulator
MDPFPKMRSGGRRVNNVQRYREQQLMAKAELARKAGVSESTIDRIEAGKDCRMETKRKVLFALGLTLQDSGKLFGRRRNGARNGHAK